MVGLLNQIHTFVILIDIAKFPTYKIMPVTLLSLFESPKSVIIIGLYSQCVKDLAKHLWFPLLFIPFSSLAFSYRVIFLSKVYPSEFPVVVFCWWQILLCLSEKCLHCPPSLK